TSLTRRNCIRVGGRSGQGEAAHPARATIARTTSGARTRNEGSAQVGGAQAGAEELIAEDPVDGQTALRDRVGHGGEGRGQLHRAHGVVVEELDARGAPALDELQLSTLGDAELDGQLTPDAPARGLVRIDPLALDPLADLVEVVLVLRIRCVEGDRFPFDAPAAALEPAPTAPAEHAR